jgi:shikimate dehydrogenase
MAIDATYEAWPTTPEEMPGAIERLRGDDILGMNVTVPHKQAVMALLDEIEESAAAIGAVNCIRKQDGRLIGHNTDKQGFIQSLRDAGLNPTGKRALVLGVGGSARAVCVGLLEARASTLTLAGRSPERVAELAGHLRRFATVAEINEVGWRDTAFAAACEGADIVVNCTPIGMAHTETEGESPLPRELSRRGLWVCDLVYNPLETVLLREARAIGGHAVPGLEMLVLQAVESVRLWTNREPPIDIMRTAASRALGLGD